MLKRSDVETIADKIQDLVEEWGEDATNSVSWNGERVQDFEFVADKIHQEMDPLATMDIEFDARRIVLAIDELDRQIQVWKEARDLSPDSEAAHPGGNRDLWAAFREIADARSRMVRRPKPEPIKDLIDQGVSDRQIAKIYHWRTDEGAPDVARVSREKADPGSEYDPAKWSHPLDEHDRKELDGLWATRQKLFDEWQAKAKVRTLEAPETIEELIRQRVGSKQIAKMKNTTVEAVKEVAAQIAVPLDGQFVPRVSPADRQAAIREAESEQDEKARQRMIHESSHPEVESLEERVVLCHLEGLATADIAEALQDKHPGLRHQKVTAIIKKAETANA